MGPDGEVQGVQLAHRHWLRIFHRVWQAGLWVHAVRQVVVLPKRATSPVALSSNLTSVTVNGQEALNLPVVTPSTEQLDWAKAFYQPTTHQFWLAFHTRNQAWFQGPNAVLNISVVDSAGNCLFGSYAPVLTTANLTWITPLPSCPAGTAGQQCWIAHVHNYDPASPYTLPSLSFDGASVTTTPPLPATLPPSSHLVLTFAVPQVHARGDLFTVQLGPGLGYGGRTPDLRYPIEVWPRSSDCPVPGVNDTTASELTSHGIDTVFYAKGDFESNCHVSFANAANVLAPRNDFYLFTDVDGMSVVNASGIDHVSGILLADEGDGNLDQNLRALSQTSNQMNAQYPNVLTYQGGKTNRYDGAYAGITDWQGLDFYVAACAPTIVTVVATLPLQGSYAYIKNARDNHTPLPSITYSQLYGNWDVEPHGNELVVEIASVLLAGSKGITMFQSVQQYFDSNRADWDGVVKSLLLSIASPIVREVLRSGDIQSFAFTSSDHGDPIASISSLTEVIRNHEYILIVVVSTDASGYSNLLCHVYVSDHWNFVDHTVSAITIAVSSDAVVTQDNVAALSEIVAGSPVAPNTVEAVLSGSTLTLSNVTLSADNPVRLFLLPYTLAGA